ncbi:MAG: phospholipase D-like domain-containing protein [Candidatus Kariarchaeaceae archaeon]
MMIFSPVPVANGTEGHSVSKEQPSPLTYTPTFDALNIKEQMTLTPMFTPDNALSTHIGWINSAINTIDIQNQYIKFFDDYDDWETNPTPFVEALLQAKGRGVTIRVQLRDEESDTDDVAVFLAGKGILTRYMGESANNPDGDWLSFTHNKLMIIDGEVVLVSSINFGTAFTNSREAGMVIQNQAAANYFTLIFQRDWADGVIVTSSLRVNGITNPVNLVRDDVDYPSHTNIPKSNFSGIYNVTLFANPDNADEVIFKSLQSAKESIYVSMYTISRPDFTNALIALKNANPSIDIQVLISTRRVGADENTDTWEAVRSLVDNLIPVYNASVAPFIDNAGFYHNKYWIIDGKHTFVYSGNWSPRSVTPLEAVFSSDEGNRDMGVAVHDATDIADFYKNVWDADVAIADEWELPVGIKQSSFEDAEIVSGSVDITGQINELDGATVSYRWGDSAFQTISLSGSTFSTSYDTTTLDNGITTLEVKAELGEQIFRDDVTVNVVNYGSTDNWRFLITELLPNPEGTDNPAEFIELTNSFPFPLRLDNWQVGDDTDILTFLKGTTVESYSSILIAKDKTGFQSIYGGPADYELDFTLKNTDGDYVQLLDASGNYLDVVAYGISAPDSSESLAIPSSGEAIQRVELHLDTDKASDFTTGSPDPRGSVPSIPLGESDTTTETPFLISWTWLMIILPILKKRKKL